MLTLVKKAMRGDKDAFIVLMDKHSGSMLRIAHGYLSQEADIADVIQDTILDAYEHLPSLKEPRYFKTWLIRILLNNCNHIYNRNKNYIPLEEISENLTDTAQEVDTPLFKFRELLSYTETENTASKKRLRGLDRKGERFLMKKEHRDSDLYEILHFTPEITSEIEHSMDTAYEQIRRDSTKTRKKTNKNSKKKRTFFYMGLAAAFLFAFGFWGFSNPVLAGKIPFLGRIFRLVENDIGYSGNYSENAVQLTDPENPNSNSQDETPNADGFGSDDTTSGNNAYSQTANGVTVTLSEASYSELALYFSVEIYCEEGFPEDFNWVKNWDEYILSYDFLYMTSSQQFDFSQADPALYNTDSLSCTEEEGLPTPYNIEGNYADSHTFLGVIRIDLETIRQIMGADALPPEFIYSFTIQKFWHDMNEGKAVTATSEDGETITLMNRVKKYYDGPWSFTIPVSMEQTNTQTKELMQTNADGIGISRVTKTPYEIKADIILPADADPFDYIVAITDADGKILDSQGEISEIYSVYGRNTDTVHIYVMDYFTFMDECKAENASLLPEKALLQTTVEW